MPIFEKLIYCLWVPSTLIFNENCNRANEATLAKNEKKKNKKMKKY